MANFLYDKGREGFLDGSIDWDTNDIKAVLVACGSSHYVASQSTDDLLADIVVGDRIATSANLGSKTVTGGVADAADVTFSSVSGAEDVDAVVIYKDSGDPATSRLIAYLDTGTGLPTTPNGSDITVQWDNGANKIFKL
jgi:hypothetical protein